MNVTKIRKEITLDAEIVSILKEKARKEGRNLKNYMEFILKEKANEFEVTEEYKTMMDELLEKHHAGKIEYTDWEIVKNELSEI